MCNKIIRKTILFLTSIALFATEIPAGSINVYADEESASPIIGWNTEVWQSPKQLQESTTENWQGDRVEFGEHNGKTLLWDILDSETSNFEEEDQAFLLANKSFEKTQYNNKNSFNFTGSLADKQLKAIYDAQSDNVKKYISETTGTGDAFEAESSRGEEIFLKDTGVENAYFFIPSLLELSNPKYGFWYKQLQIDTVGIKARHSGRTTNSGFWTRNTDGNEDGSDLNIRASVSTIREPGNIMQDIVTSDFYTVAAMNLDTSELVLSVDDSIDAQNFATTSEKTGYKTWKMYFDTDADDTPELSIPVSSENLEVNIKGTKYIALTKDTPITVKVVDKMTGSDNVIAMLVYKNDGTNTGKIAAYGNIVNKGDDTYTISFPTGIKTSTSYDLYFASVKIDADSAVNYISDIYGDDEDENIIPPIWVEPTVEDIGITPTITKNIEDIYIDEGESGQLTIEATKAKGYEWYYRPSTGGGWIKLNGSSSVADVPSSSYTINAKAKDNNNEYKCVVLGNKPGYEVESNIIKLHVTNIGVYPTITKNLESDIYVVEDATGTLTIKADNATQYNWYCKTKDADTWELIKKDITVAGTSSIDVVSSEETDGNHYKCVVLGNKIGYETESNITHFHLADEVFPVSIIQQPSSITIMEGETGTFFLEALNVMQYEWYFGMPKSQKDTFVSIGTGFPTLTIAQATASMTGQQFFCRVYAMDGTYIDSDVVTITVNTKSSGGSSSGGSKKKKKHSSDEDEPASNTGGGGGGSSTPSAPTTTDQTDWTEFYRQWMLYWINMYQNKETTTVNCCDCCKQDKNGEWNCKNKEQTTTEEAPKEEKTVVKTNKKKESKTDSKIVSNTPAVLGESPNSRIDESTFVNIDEPIEAPVEEPIIEEEEDESSPLWLWLLLLVLLIIIGDIVYVVLNKKKNKQQPQNTPDFSSFDEDDDIEDDFDEDNNNDLDIPLNDEEDDDEEEDDDDSFDESFDTM